MAQRGSPGKGLTKDEAKAAKENHFSEFIKLFTHLSIWGAKVEKRIHHLKFKFWEDRTDQPYFPRTQNMLFLKYQNLGYLQKVLCCLKILRKMVFLRKRQPPYPPHGDWPGFQHKSIFLSFRNSLSFFLSWIPIFPLFSFLPCFRYTSLPASWRQGGLSTPKYFHFFLQNSYLCFPTLTPPFVVR